MKTCLITGATSGIGKQTAVELAKLGMQVVFTSRDSVKGEVVAKEIKQLSQNQNVSWLECDLASLQNVKECVDRFLDQHSQLDVLINNAGVWQTKFELSVDGFELTFAVNHLAPFYMTNLLLDKLKSSAPSRVVTVASAAHYQARELDLERINSADYFGLQSTYQRSKLCNILFTKKLATLVPATQVSANCLHPGLVNTNLFRKMPFGIDKLLKFIEIPVTRGAQTSVFLASDPSIATTTGQYFNNKKVTIPSKLALDENLANQLWEFSLNCLNQVKSTHA